MFGTNMKHRLIDLGMMQRDLAAKTGMTEAAISRYATNERIPRVDKAQKIAKALGMTLDELVDYEERR